MKMSRTCTYAISAAVCIASGNQEQLVIGRDLAQMLGLPQGFLLRILVSLSRAGILWSSKGPNGGYRLARPGNKITLLDVVEAVEGPLEGHFMSTSVEGTKLDRRLEAICKEATEMTRRHLRRVHLAELVGKTR